MIESLSTKLTMFAPNSTPLRATCTVKLKEVYVLAKLLEEGGVANEVLRPLLKWKRQDAPRAHQRLAWPRGSKSLHRSNVVARLHNAVRCPAESRTRVQPPATSAGQLADLS